MMKLAIGILGLSAAGALLVGCGSSNDEAAAAESACIEAVGKDFNPDGLAFRDTETELRNDGYFTTATVDGKYSFGTTSDVYQVSCLTPAGGVAEVLGYGSDGEPAPDHRLTPREKACRAIVNLSPGTLETMWDYKTLADPNATSSQRREAILRQSDIGSGQSRQKSYSCSGPTFERYLEEHGG